MELSTEGQTILEAAVDRSDPLTALPAAGGPEVEGGSGANASQTSSESGPPVSDDNSNRLVESPTAENVPGRLSTEKTTSEVQTTTPATVNGLSSVSGDRPTALPTADDRPDEAAAPPPSAEERSRRLLTLARQMAAKLRPRVRAEKPVEPSLSTEATTSFEAGVTARTEVSVTDEDDMFATTAASFVDSTAGHDAAMEPFVTMAMPLITSTDDSTDEVEEGEEVVVVSDVVELEDRDLELNENAAEAVIEAKEALEEDEENLILEVNGVDIGKEALADEI